MSLDGRKSVILKAVVDDYIATAEPVGSKSIVTRHNLNLSSATVRNILAELEKQGYLMQPHTSAGRIPTDEGYRAYVDSLMTLTDLPEDEKTRMENELNDVFSGFKPILRKTAELLSETTGYAALAVAPHSKDSILRQLKILMIEPGRALIVVVVSGGLVKNRMARVPNMFTLEQLIEIANTVEQGLQGKRLSDITMVTVETSAYSIELPDSLLNQVLYEAYVSIKQAENLETYTNGITNLFQHPEFRNVDRAMNVMDTLTKNGGMVVGMLADRASARPAAETVTEEHSDLSIEAEGRKAYPDYFMIRIGQEIAIETLEDCSFITTTYRLGDQLLGDISLIGPKRMNYDDVISRIRFVRYEIQQSLPSEPIETDS
ncbi:MAG: heat-inducible transcriptional repressor HrcA [Fastidiosipilaceae bacterium]